MNAHIHIIYYMLTSYEKEETNDSQIIIEQTVKNVQLECTMKTILQAV